MTPLWTGADIAAATGGNLSTPFVADGVTFDSREVIGGELFVAMRGEQADGHDYVAMAAGRGAAGFLVERPVPHPHVQVADSFAALEALGRAARARTGATIVGVTGSVGKTGTKEALRLAFERIAPDATHASVKSYNNHTGVPLSLARMPADSRFGVFEMGMNHVGELSALTRLVRQDLLRKLRRHREVEGVAERPILLPFAVDAIVVDPRLHLADDHIALRPQGHDVGAPPIGQADLQQRRIAQVAHQPLDGAHRARGSRAHGLRAHGAAPRQLHRGLRPPRQF